MEKPDQVPISPASIVSLSAEQVSADLGGEAAILDLKHGIYYGLDAVGAVVWSLLEIPRTAGEVRDEILERFDVDPDRCWRDLSALLSELASRGLIEIRSDSAG